MRTPLIALALLLTATAVRADMGVPWVKRVPTVAILQSDEQFHGMQVFVVCRDHVEPLRMLDPRTGRVDPLHGPFRNQPVKLCAIGPAELPKEPKELTVEWLTKQPGAIWSPEVPVRWDSISVANSRETTELHYRVELTPDGMRLSLTSIEVRDNWSAPLAGGACLLSVLAAGSMFVWLGLKAFRRRVTRTVPPPIQ